MKRTWSVICVLTLLLAMTASVTANTLVPRDYTEHRQEKLLNDEPSPAPAAIGQPPIGELDEIIGDTVVIGNTWRDMQHNGTLGNMIVMQPVNDDSSVFHYIWTYRDGPQGLSRAYYKSARLGSDGMLDVDAVHQAVHAGANFSAYTVINYSTYPDDQRPVATYHGGPSAGTDYFDYHATENPFIPTVWNTPEIPQLPDMTTMWPHTQGGLYNGEYYLHTMLNEYLPDPEVNEATHLNYNRMAYNPVQFQFNTNATPGGAEQIQITEYAMNLSNEVAVSDDGSKVTLAQTISRWMLTGEGGDDWISESPGYIQRNNDIYLWTSEDGGDTWDFGVDNGFNMTNFLEPDLNALPDTVQAEKDTLRAHTEVDLHYDGDDRLHAVFNANIMAVVREYGTIMGRLFYWNDDHQMFTQIQDGTFWNNCVLPAWENVVGNAQVYKDDSSDIVWCSFVMFGVEGDTVETGEDAGYPLDSSDANSPDGFTMKASDIWISASPDNGLHWATPINVTNTRNEGYALLPYETESEREMTMAENNDGDYLHLFYTLDYDPGVAVPADAATAEGEGTDNPVIHHMVDKVELLQMFDQNATWVRNYPLHYDSTAFYQDPDDWQVYEPFLTSVEDKGETLRPDQFELKQNYPNPFNPSTQIQFSLNTPGHVKLAVYDVLGREVAVLVDRGMNVGTHNVNFLADDLASGVYFYKLSSGDAVKSRKMVLMK